MPLFFTQDIVCFRKKKKKTFAISTIPTDDEFNRYNMNNNTKASYRCKDVELLGDMRKKNSIRIHIFLIFYNAMILIN